MCKIVCLTRWYIKILDKKYLLVYIRLVREMFLKEALKMTEKTNVYKSGVQALEEKGAGAGYKKGRKAVNFAAKFLACGVNVHDTQYEK